VEAWNKAQSTSLHGSVTLCQGILSYVQWYQNHLWHSAWPKRVKSIIPTPPSSFGLHTISHFTKHIPSLLSSLSSPFHKKFILNLSIFFMSHLGSGKTVMSYVTVDVWSSDIWSRTGGNTSRWDQSYVNIKHEVLDWFEPSCGVITLRSVLMYYAIEVSLLSFFWDLSGIFQGVLPGMFSRCPRCGSIIFIYSRKIAS
jgi:hypothetical protein